MFVQGFRIVAVPSVSECYDSADDVESYQDIIFHFIMIFTSLMPNKSPEPTAVGAVRSAIAVHAAGRRWLSFLR